MQGFARLLAIALVALSAGSALAGPALVFEATSGRVLYAEDADHPWYPASLTKLMTAYITFEDLKAGKIKLTDKLKCSAKAHEQPPSKLGLPVGAEISVELGLKVLIVKSANDVALMLAETVAGSEEAFVARMNATAKRLGMTSTRFKNPHGLPDPDQFTTARDLARLSKAIIKDFPEHAALFTLDAVQVGNRKLGTHNALLKVFQGADGLKTGFICDAGYNVVASATRDGTRIVAVVLGEPSGHERTIRASSLLEHGFHNYTWKALFFTGVTLEDLPRSTGHRGLITMRESVTGWDCNRGARARARAVARAKARRQRAAKARAKGKGRAAVKKAAPGKKTAKPAPKAKKKLTAKPATTTKSAARAKP
ncbi:MAG: D-alanyl-D-alanine carboxypeptidase family protein [Hyphomicrobiaceae bacterium]